jgi:hypothetical protein
VSNLHLIQFHVYVPKIPNFVKTTSLPETRFDELYSLSTDRWPLKLTAGIENPSFVRMSDAFRWWNAHVGTHDNPNNPPSLVLPKCARTAWSRICPIFLLFVIDESDLQTYWESIQSIVLMFDHEKKVPNPVTRFPAFIWKVYSLRNILTPRNVTESINLIDRFGFHDSAHCFLYQTPVFLASQSLYLDTILAMRERHHQLWANFVSNLQLITAFFDLYSNFATPILHRTRAAFWRHRFLITEVFYWIIQDTSFYHQEIALLVSRFFDLSIVLLENADYEASILLLRPILASMKQFGRLLPREQIQARALSVLCVLDKWNSPHFLLAFRFLLSVKPALLHANQVIQLISGRKIRAVSDIQMLLLLADHMSAIPICSLLVREGLSDKVWHRACFGAVREIIDIFGCRPDFREWLALLIRRLFVLVAFAETRGKYSTRNFLLCESLSHFRQANLVWVRQIISVAASSVAVKRAPVYFRNMFPILQAVVDESLAFEFDSFVRSRTDLKMFPFDKLKKTLITAPINPQMQPYILRQPELKRSSCRRFPVAIKCDVSGPMAKKRGRAGKKNRKEQHLIVKKTRQFDHQSASRPAVPR